MVEKVMGDKKRFGIELVLEGVGCLAEEVLAGFVGCC
jgi:hypothetical protein